MSNRRTAPWQPITIVQNIVVEWGAESRSAELATLRRQLLRFTPLPEVKVEMGSCVIFHTLFFRDWNKFAKSPGHIRQYGDIATSQLGRVLLRWDDGLQVTYRFGSGNIRTQHFRLATGETGKVEYNERIVWEDCWRYQHHLTFLSVQENFSRRIPLPPLKEKVIEDLVHLYYS